MADHFSLLRTLTYRQMNLGMAQTLLDEARSNHPYDQLLQLELDRRQTEITEEQKEIKHLMFTIPLNN